MKRKKLIAVLAAAAMTVSTGAAGVSASTAYQDAEKAALAKAVAELTETYGTSLAEYSEQITKPSGADITLTLDDAGKAVLGALVPSSIDVSWLNDLQFSADVSLTDGKIADKMDVNLNGSKILTMEVYMDYSTWDTYIRIPELSDAYLRTNALQTAEQAESDLNDAVDSSFSVSSSVDNPEFMQAYMNAVTNLEEYLPAADEFGTLLDRYGNLVISAFGEDEAESGSETLTVGDVSEDCTVLEASLDQTEAQNALMDILSAAKEDAEIKTLIEKWSALDTSGSLTYEAYQSKIDELLGSIEESADTDTAGDTTTAETTEDTATPETAEDITASETTEDDAALETAETSVEEEITGFTDSQNPDFRLTSKIWTDGDGNIAGRQIALTGMSDSDIILTCQAPSTEEGSALLFQYEDGSNTYTFSGTGTLNGDLLSGYYELSANGAAVAGVTVTDYDTAAMSENNWNGNYEISLLEGVGEDIYSSLGSFGLTVNAAGSKTDGSMALALTGSGVPYLSLTVAAREGTAVEYPDTSALGTVYDTSSDDDMSAYTSSISTDTVFANLTAAGMPDGFIENLIAAMSEDSSEDETDYYDESEIIGGADETTDIYLDETTETTTADAAA